MRESGVQGAHSMRINALDQSGCRTIVDAVFKVLETVGCKVASAGAQELMRAAGCSVDGDTVRVPAAVMQAAIDCAPKSVKIYDRAGNLAMDLASGNSYFGPGICNPFIVDSVTGERRRTTLADTANVARVCEELENINWVGGLGSAGDCPQQVADLYETEQLLANTTKPIVPWTQGSLNCRAITEMCAAAVGGMSVLREKPSVIVWLSPISPLSHPDDVVAPLLYLAEKRLPVMYVSGATAGGTAPISQAGGLVIGIADALVGLLISQLKNPGAPFICGCSVEVMNMRTMGMAFADPARLFSETATADVFEYLGLPVAVHIGTTDSYAFDEQAAGDISMQMLAGVLSKGTMNCFVGFLESGMSGSLEAIVYGNEIIDLARRYSRACDLSADALALGVIEEVGIGGNFLSEEHTMDNLDLLWEPRFLERGSYEKWVEVGRPSLFDKLNGYVRKILEQPSGQALPMDVHSHVADIAAQAAN